MFRSYFLPFDGREEVRHLPKVCLSCGRDATETIEVEFSKRQADGTVELFLDGISIGKTRGRNSAGAITTDLRAIGSERYWATHRSPDNPHYTGAIDEVAVFKRALAADEILALAGHVKE